MPDSNTHSNDTAPAASNVAVIIPFYNGSAFIERALRSVYAQSAPAAEVVVVNDGSTPEERAFLQQIQLQYGFTLIDQTNGGQGAARNAGVAASSAPYICFLDQDDFYLEHHTRLLVKAIPRDEPRWGYVYADLWEADGEGMIVRNTIANGPGKHPKQDLFEMLQGDLFVLPSATLIRRTAFEAVGGFDTQFTGYEDDDLFLRLFRAGYTSHFANKAVTVWCIHTSSTSFSMRMSHSRIKYFKKLAETFPDEPMRKHYYLRDCLVPRFGHYFIGHAVRAIKAHDENLPEIRAILDEYAAIVLANPNIRFRSRLKLRTALALVRYSPPWVIRVSDRLARLPGMAWLRR
ncbi:MAG: glycosyltransferase family 2 protein [Burkholderiaceae bacterium]|jgi:GT2 family glycosyltransferase|nr:glycosyltransferase family 2 protein [Burkholderiaceae bacterium]